MIDVWKDYNPIKAALNRASGIVANGWIQNSIRVDDKYCAVAAIEQAAADISRETGGNVDRIDTAINSLNTFRKFIRHNDVGKWNDSPKRTQQEVVEALLNCSEAI